jgi:D-glycero-D-manno-heptose 1,7-bisphosphate phosphatase
MNKALFLDRDGVINVEKHHLYQREAFEFQTGIFELCRAAQSQGFLLIVVTNQAGIARGLYREADFLDLTDWMIREFAERQIQIARVYYCPYHPVHGIGPYKRDSPDRKPGPGMLLRAGQEWNLDLSASALIGDHLSDIDAACAAGVGTRILLRSESEPAAGGRDCHVADSLDDIRQRFFARELNAV